MMLDVLERGTAPTVVSQVPRKTVAEFFAGIGLMRMGLEQAGWSVVFANDIDPQKQAMYTLQFGQDDHFICEDIHKLSAASIPDVTLATASFPCTDLSLAGAREGLAGKQSSAFWGFRDILREMGDRRPPLILIENVPDFLSSHKGKDFEEALRSLNDLGYYVDALILDAAWFVPQSRRRLFVVGVQEALVGDTEEFALQENDIRPKALLAFMRQHPEIKWSVHPLPAAQQQSPQLASILDELPEEAPEWWSQARADYLLSQMSPRHREIANCMIAGDDWAYGTVFRRMRKGKSMAELRSDGIAGCLRTPKGGSAKQILFKAGKGKFFARHLTPREAARLMGADEFALPRERDQALFGFGDAVCVPVVKWIATHYLNPVVDELLHNQQRSLAPHESVL